MPPAAGSEKSNGKLTELLERIPEHLREYITAQNPLNYTPIDHASWRYIMRVSKMFFAKHAHPLYLKGLDFTGISSERVPLISEMDTALRKIGWRAVAINGFIPPAAFLEFQSLKILAIACDMRKIENLGYTPSPDIVHEAAGHAPIVVDPLYRDYLESYGEVARNAIINKADLDLYDVILELSEIKENPNSTPEQIESVQKRFEFVAASIKEPSEAALLARMAWWTTEYGLVGSIEKPLIYGAGLLSSVEESFNCLGASVKKIPFSLEAVVNTSYDITRHQPQLFVAKSFSELTNALERFAQGMAYRLGGEHGLATGKKAQTTVTVVMDNGIQFSGTLTDYEMNEFGEEVSITISGAKQLSYENKTQPEVSHHHFGQSLVLPFLDRSVSTATMDDIQRKIHGSGLVTKNGSRITGRFKKEVSLGGRVRLLILENVTITNKNGQVIFEEKTREYPLIFANKVLSVFGGAADRNEFALRNSSRKQSVKAHKSNLTQENLRLNELYYAVRDFRENKKTNLDLLDFELKEFIDFYPSDWLLRLEFYELYRKHAPENLTTATLKKGLIALTEEDPSLKNIIQRGLDAIEVT